MRSLNGLSAVPPAMFPLSAPRAGASGGRQAAEEFVSLSLVEPILKQLRETSGAAPPFAPGAAEKSFRGMLDAAIAKSVVRGGNWPLVERVRERIEARGGVVA